MACSKTLTWQRVLLHRLVRRFTTGTTTTLAHGLVLPLMFLGTRKRSCVVVTAFSTIRNCPLVLVHRKLTHFHQCRFFSRLSQSNLQNSFPLRSQAAL